MEVPFFSIIVPVYNSEKYIRKCINSVIQQTFSLWELILIDDGSTDNSGEICDSFCFDSRIKVIHQNNKGALQSRLNGIAIANGKYELGLDSDDYLDNICLETLKKAIEVSGSDLILFGIRLVGNRRCTIKCTLKPNKIYSQRELLTEVIEKTNHSLSNKAIRMDKVKQANYSGIKKRLSINLDYEQIIPIMCNIDNGYVIDDVLYNYRFRANSISHSSKVQYIFDTGVVTEYVIYKLRTAGLMDDELYSKVFIGYFNIITHRLYRLFFDKRISKEDCRMIHKSKIYKKSKRFEKMENMRKFDYIILKLFRYKFYWILELMPKLLKI